MASSAPPNPPDDLWKTVEKTLAAVSTQRSSDSVSTISSVDTGTSGSDDEVPSDYDDNFWDDELDWDWASFTQDMKKSQNWKSNISKVQEDPKAPAPLRKPPQKANFRGDFHYVEYIPAWTSPKYDPRKEFIGAEGKDEHYFERFSSSFFSRLRPAQSLLDSFYNPTEMAKRYGIYPRRRDGRSRLSPLDSLARRVQLEKAILTPNGTKRGFVNIENYKSVYDHEYMAPGNVANREAGQSFKDFLTELSAAGSNPQQQQDLSEFYEKLLLLHRQIEQDQEYQRAFFLEFTTDELVSQQVLCFQDEIENDLQGDLHPFLKRTMWATTEDRGIDQDMPKLLWAFDGKRGEWTGHDDTIWDALQPALQLVTRLLKADIPAFTSLMNYCSQQPIHQNMFAGRPNRLRNCRRRSAWFREVDLNNAWSALQELHSTGFDSVSWVNTILKERLVLSLGSAWRDEDGRCNETHYAWTSIEGQTWRASNSSVLAGNWRIRVEIAGELVWPLLSTYFTKSEKLTCSFAVAATILHEMCHAIVNVLDIMRTNPHDFFRQENGGSRQISQEAKDALEEAANEMPKPGNEPFFENQTQAEVGYAVENEVFGGIVIPIARLSGGHTPDNLGLLATALSTSCFPEARPVEPRVNKLGNEFLPTLTAPVVNVSTPLPFYLTAKFFTQRFWDTDFKKFGLETLKLHAQGTISKGAVSDMSMYMADQLSVVFGNKKGFWMNKAVRELHNNGYDTIADYLEYVCRQYTSFKVTRRNWYFDSRRWPLELSKIESCLDGLRATGTDFVVNLCNLTANDGAQHEQSVRQYIASESQAGRQPPDFASLLRSCRDSMVQTTEQCFSRFLAWLKTLERLLAVRLRHVQFLVRSYLELDVSERHAISQGRGKTLRKHMKQAVISPFRQVQVCLAAMTNLIRARVGDDSSRGSVAELNQAHAHLQTIAHMTRTTMSYLKPENEQNHVGGDGAVLSYLSGSTFNPARRAERLKPLVMADLEYVKVDWVKDIVKVFDTIFRGLDGKEILPKDQETLDKTLAHVTDLLSKKSFGSGPKKPSDDGQPSSSAGQPKPSGSGLLHPGQRGANMFTLSSHAGSSRVSKHKKSSETKLNRTLGSVIAQDPTAKSNNKFTYSLAPTTTTTQPTLPTGIASAQASGPFAQYASANTAMAGFPAAAPGQPPAFAGPAAAMVPSSSSSSLQQQPAYSRPAGQQRFPLFPHPFADQLTLNEDLTQAERDWGAQLAQAQLPVDMRSYQGRVADILTVQDHWAASALLAMSALGPSSQAGGSGTGQRALAVHATVGAAVGAAMPSIQQGTDLNAAAASIQSVQLPMARWALEWASGNVGAGAGAGDGDGDGDGAATMEGEVAAYATRRMFQRPRSLPQFTGSGDGAAVAADPRAGEAPIWRQSLSTAEVMDVVMGTDDDDEEGEENDG